MFEKGQKVVCINDTFPPVVHRLFKELPKKDQIYTVRDINIGRTRVTSGPGGENEMSFIVLLEELHNPNDPYMSDAHAEEMGFRSDRFAPLEEMTMSVYNEVEEPFSVIPK